MPNEPHANGVITAETQHHDAEAGRETSDAVPGVVVPASAALQSTLSNAVEVTARATIQDDAPQPLSPRALTEDAAQCALPRCARSIRCVTGKQRKLS